MAAKATSANLPSGPLAGPWWARLTSSTNIRQRAEESQTSESGSKGNLLGMFPGQRVFFESIEVCLLAAKPFDDGERLEHIGIIRLEFQGHTELLLSVFKIAGTSQDQSQILM